MKGNLITVRLANRFMNPCRFCDGNCCISFIITVTAFDVLRAAKASGAKPDDFAYLRRLDLLNFNDADVIECYEKCYGKLLQESYLLVLKSHPCFFYNTVTGCKVHEKKPLACRLYPFDEKGSYGKRAMCPLVSNAFFRFAQPSAKLFEQYRKEKAAHAKIVAACNKRKLTKEVAFRFILAQARKK
ncbi:MAG: YkgJ family cysteine cluster protein [Candidatus Micrarchaeota archaeon]